MTSSLSSRPPPPSKLLDLELTILSAKHLKNINWRNGDIKPYVVFWLDTYNRLVTKPDPSGSTKPVWNETFTLPIGVPLLEAFLGIEILHSKPSETPNPLIGSVQIPLNDVVDGVGTLVRKFELLRPSGRPQGAIVVKLSVSERHALLKPYYYSLPAPPPPSRDYRQYPPPSPYGAQFPLPPPSPAPVPYYVGYSEPSYNGYYGGNYQQPPIPQPKLRPYFDRQSSYGGPSAPVDYAVLDQKQKGSGKLGVGAGADGMGRLTLHEGVKYDEEKVGSERAESDLASRDGYGHNHSHYHSEY